MEIWCQCGLMRSGRVVTHMVLILLSMVLSAQAQFESDSLPSGKLSRYYLVYFTHCSCTCMLSFCISVFHFFNL